MSILFDWLEKMEGYYKWYEFYKEVVLWVYELESSILNNLLKLIFIYIFYYEFFSNYELVRLKKFWYIELKRITINEVNRYIGIDLFNNDKFMLILINKVNFIDLMFIKIIKI
jgi:hypothetical protein